jgi:hypothetical protein
MRIEMSRKTDLDNHSNQLNPNHPEYLNCRDHPDSNHDEDYDEETFSAAGSLQQPIIPALQRIRPRPANFIDTIDFPPIVPEKLPAHVAAMVAAFEKINF